MRATAKAIRKWRNRAIFLDFSKVTIDGLYQGEESQHQTNVPSKFLKDSIAKMRPHKEVSLHTKPIVEVLSGTLSIFCFVVFVYIKMLSLEVSGQEAASQLETYSVLSLVIGTTFFVTLMTSIMFRKIFNKEA